MFFIHRKATAKQRITIMREIFSTFGVAENIATDDRSQFRANEMETFLTRWGMDHRISSDYNPHSYRMSVISVKTAKRPLMTITKFYGYPDWDKVSQALLQHRNTQIRDINLSLAHLRYQGAAPSGTWPVSLLPRSPLRTVECGCHHHYSHYHAARHHV